MGREECEEVGGRSVKRWGREECEEMGRKECEEVGEGGEGWGREERGGGGRRVNKCCTDCIVPVVSWAASREIVFADIYGQKINKICGHKY